MSSGRQCSERNGYPDELLCQSVLRAGIHVLITNSFPSFFFFLCVLLIIFYHQTTKVAVCLIACEEVPT